MIIMFGLGMSYYGVPLAVRDIKVNIYLSEALNAMVELPTFVVTPILLEKFSRRSSVLVSCLIGGASGVLCFVMSLYGRTKIAFALELGSFFFARIGFNLMAVYMVELFPTCVRNSATMMLRQAERLWLEELVAHSLLRLEEIFRHSLSRISDLQCRVSGYSRCFFLRPKDQVFVIQWKNKSEETKP
ncbi:unnamed protein product [Arabidopsis halleri]